MFCLRPNALCVFLLMSPLLWYLRIAPDSPPRVQPSASTQTSVYGGDRHLDRGERIARAALAYRGGRYAFGGRGPRAFDCSGLTQVICLQLGVVLQRTAAEQFTHGLPVPFERLAPGDLVFFRNTYKQGISHVGIYVGDGRFVHAANRKEGIIVSSLYEPYYAHRLAGARRMVPPPGGKRK